MRNKRTASAKLIPVGNMSQMSLFDLIDTPSEGIPDIDMGKYINAPEPLCYDCQFAIRRGPFRLCQKGKKGYRKIGEEVNCKIYAPLPSL